MRALRSAPRAKGRDGNARPALSCDRRIVRRERSGDVRAAARCRDRFRGDGRTPSAREVRGSSIPQDGQFDLSYFLENPRGFLPIPIVVTEPAVGYGGGAAGMFLRPRREAGDEGWARPDISAVGAFATQNGTWGAFAADASRWLDGRLRTLIGAATGQVNLDFFGLGPDTSSLDQGGALLAAVQRGRRTGQLATCTQVALGSRCALCLCRRRPQAARRSAFSGSCRPGFASRSRPRRPSWNSTRETMCSRPREGSMPNLPGSRRAKRLGASDDFERFQQVLIGWHPLPIT